MSVNRATIIGNLGRDPEVQHVGSNNDAVCKFSVATSEKWNDKSGQKQESTEWHNVVVWRKMGEACGTHLRKGSQCYVEGKLQTRKWEDKDGNKRNATEIVASRVVFLDPKPGTGERNSGSQGGGDRQHDYGPPPLGDDDIPF